MSKSLKKLIDINRLREFKNKLNAQIVFESRPTGVIIPFAGTSVPTGYLLCNGAAVSRINYANLFAAIGTLYGAGDGSTTFNLPDARDRVLQGASGRYSAGSYIAAGLPNITGMAQSTQVGIFHRDPSSYSGALFTGGDYPYVASGQPGAGGVLAIHINASRSSSYYGASDTVQPPAIATNFIIKY